MVTVECGSGSCSGILPHVHVWATAGRSWATYLVALYVQSSAELMGNTQYTCVNYIA